MRKRPGIENPHKTLTTREIMNIAQKIELSQKFVERYMERANNKDITNFKLLPPE